MSRVRNYFHAVWSGSLLTVIIALLNLVTMRIAVTALGKSGYGVWLAVMQLAVFTNIFDLGIGGSMARFFADYKEQADQRPYASFLKSLFFVGALQGILFTVVAAGSLPFLPALMNIPAADSHLFKVLVVFQFTTSALAFPLRPFNQLLYAHQQIGRQNICYIVATLVNAVVLISALQFGWGAYSYIAANWVAFAVNQFGTIYFVIKLGFLPPLRGATISLKALRPLARFSANIFITTLGSHLINLAPGLLVTRKLGLAALTDWTIGTRVVLFVAQLITRLPNSSEPVFWEMFSRKEISRVRQRLLELLLLTGSAIALLGAGFAATNKPFISLWMSHRVQWSTGTDLVLVAWVLVSITSVVFSIVPGMTKHLGSIALVYVLEGGILTAIAYVPAAQFQTYSQVALLLLAFDCLFRFPYGLWRTWRDLQIPARILGGALGRLFGVTGLLLCVAILLGKLTGQWTPVSQVAVNGVAYALVALPVVYYALLPVEPRKRILETVLRRLGKV